MDEADRAQLLEEQHRAAAIERAASMARQALGRSAYSNTCEDCGCKLEGIRQAYGFRTCVDCQRDRERDQQRTW